MKKLILFLLFAALLTACDPGKYMITATHEWILKNNTNQTITVGSPLILGGVSRVVAPRDSAIIFRFEVYHDKADFEMLFSFDKAWQEGTEAGKRYDILSQNSTLLKRWTYADRDSGGRQFFNKKDWKLLKRQEKGWGLPRYYWIFEVQPEDIALP